ATRTATRRSTTLPARVVNAAPRTSPGRPHDSHRHPIRGHARRRRRRIHAPPRPTHPRTPLHHTPRTRIQEPTMTESPLTPDAIEVAIRDCMPKVALDRLSGTQVMRLAEDMHAALTEPPPRPEGAEDIERLLTEDLGDFSPPVTPEAIADLRAARGVRATGGN